MKRSGFARAVYEPAPREPLRPLARPCVYWAASDVPVVVAKGIAARPGKRAPTALEKRWMDAIVAHGCVACLLDGVWPRPACVHHILRGGVRMGHLFTLPLCPGHHQDGTGAPGLIARHPYKARFEQRYGSEFDLLARLKRELGVFDEARYEA